jgi:transposase InsO family protein
MVRKVAPMDLRLLAAVSGELDGLNVAALCRERRISRKTFYKWRARYLALGVRGLEEQPRRPHTSPRRLRAEVEDAIVAGRKHLLDDGLDAGAASIRWHLQHRVRPLPSEATIWRTLVRRGLIVPEPAKRPRRSYRRFEADHPNECWQIDTTEWELRDRSRVEIINLLDDHSRLAIASQAVLTTTSEAAWEVFSAATRRWGLPTRCLSDNGLAFSGRLRGVEVFFEANLRNAGIRPITARPYHPQTCGKVERFQQTLKHWLRARHLARTLAELQAQLDAFCEHYNHRRPHRALDGSVPFERWAASPAVSPTPNPIPARNRATRRVSRIGVVQLGRVQIHIGKRHAGQRAQLITDGCHVAVLISGQLVRQLEIDPTKTYQPSGLRRGPLRRDGT